MTAQNTEMHALMTEYAALFAQHHQQRMHKWAGLLQAFASMDPAEAVPRSRRTSSFAVA